MNECQSSLLECLSAAVRGNSNPGAFSVVSGKAADLLSLADRHSLLPLIVQHLLKTDAVPLPDKPVIDAARVKVIQQAQRTADLELLLDHLKKAGLRPVIMKGIVCRDLYPVLSMVCSTMQVFRVRCSSGSAITTSIRAS